MKEQTAGRRHVRPGRRGDLVGNVDQARGLPRTRFEEARVENALNVLVTERSDPLGIREVFQHQRHSKVRRGEVRQQQFGFARTE